MPALASYRLESFLILRQMSPRVVNMLFSIVSFVDLHTVVPGDTRRYYFVDNSRSCQLRIDYL